MKRIVLVVNFREARCFAGSELMRRFRLRPCELGVNHETNGSSVVASGFKEASIAAHLRLQQGVTGGFVPWRYLFS